MCSSAKLLFCFCALLLVLSAMLPADASEPPQTTRTATAQPIRHEEKPHDPPAMLPSVRATSPGVLFDRNGFVTVQVNVDGNGQNILDDAANEPSIAVDPNNPNRLVIGWRQFDHISSNFRQAGWAYSRDAGRSWTFPGVIEPGVFRSDPVLDVDRDGSFYYQSLNGNFELTVFKSADGGKTWGAGVPSFGGDKNWMVIDRTAGVGAGNVYGVWQRFFNCCDDDTFTRSTDGAASFDYPVHIPASPSFGTLAVGPDGEVYAGGIEAISFQNWDQLVVGKSIDAQVPGNDPTFATQPVDLGGSMVLGADPNPAGMLGQAQVAVDLSDGPTRGHVYLLCSVDPPGPDPMDVMFARSTDGGQTWSTPLRVNDDPPDTDAWQWFGTISVAPNGRIDVVWNDTRNSGGDPRLSELYYSFSTDGGASFAPSVVASPQFNSHLGWPDQEKLGDYYHMISDVVGANLAWAATFNGEQDVYFMRIGDYDCNGNGVGDSDDLLLGTSTDLNGNEIPDECESLGDLNCDEAVDFGDINPFVLALSNLGEYQTQFPDCPLENRDINGDGKLDFDDINPFVRLLTGP